MPSAIPTLYNGVQFRSRLEARWAAFFDLLGWRWTYEPVDLAGYIPDFFIELGAPPLYFAESGIYSDKFLVEVKPDAETVLDEAVAKAFEAGWTGPVVVLGSHPRIPPKDESYTHIKGLMAGDLAWIETEHGWGRLMCPIFLGVCVHCGGFALSIQPGGDGDLTHCLFCDTKQSPQNSFFLLPQVIERLWAMASNLTQWKAPIPPEDT